VRVESSEQSVDGFSLSLPLPGPVSVVGLYLPPCLDSLHPSLPSLHPPSVLASVSAGISHRRTQVFDAVRPHYWSLSPSLSLSLPLPPSPSLSLPLSPSFVVRVFVFVFVCVCVSL
jgi:hypothetical protein